MKYDNLKPYQKRFLQWLYEYGHTAKDQITFKRSHLKMISIQNGMLHPPAWLVTDINRRTIFCGQYIVPELAEYISIRQDEEDDIRRLIYRDA
jgi:hypothetical protein